MREMLERMAVSHPRLSPPHPAEIAYLVGGPADGVERDVSTGQSTLQWAEMLPMEPARLADMDSVIPASPSMRIHSYKPCPETGEWLWQGVR